MKTVPRRTLTLPLAALAALAIAAPGAWAANPGDVDTGFNPGLYKVSGVVLVNGLAVQPDAKILITGDFAKVGGSGGVARSNVARLAASGSLDTGFDPGTGLNGLGYAIAAQDDGKVLIGGAFTDVNGTTRNRIARTASDGTLDGAFNPNAGSSVWSIVPQASGKMLVGGTFGAVGGTTRYRIAQLNSDGTLAAFAPYLSYDVRAVATQSDGKTLVAGGFLNAGAASPGSTRAFVARFNADGTLDSGFNAQLDGPGPEGATFAYAVLVQPDGKVLVGGSFDTAGGGQARKGLVRLNANGSLDTGFADPGLNSRVDALALQADGKVIATGAFTCAGWNGDGDCTDAGETVRNRVARFTTDGSLDPTFNPDVDNNDVSAVAIQPDGKILIGGGFTQVGGFVSGFARRGIARLYGAPPAGAPTSPTATAGNGQATVSWTAVPGDIASYTVTSSPGGQTCTTAATSCTVTGLTNGTAYTFTIQAANEFGSGPASSATAPVTYAVPPASGASASGGAAPSSGGGAGATASAAALAGSWSLKKTTGTLRGTVPIGATTLSQSAKDSAGKAATGSCAITVVRNKKTKKVTKRTYTCTIRLSKGTWTVTTTARGAAGVVAESSRRVVVK